MTVAAEMPEVGLFVLPGGYVTAEGAVLREAELTPLTGCEEEWLSHLPPQLCTASVVTQLLARCLKRLGMVSPVNLALAGDLLTGDRDYLLLRLREMTCGSQVEAVWRCTHPACGKPVDIAFSLAELAIEEQAVSTRFFTRQLAGGPIDEAATVEFRLPTGADQAALAALVAADETQAVQQLLARCVRSVNGSPPAHDWLERAGTVALATAMEACAPQVALELEMHCPECGATHNTDFDFTAFFLGELRANQRALEREVHLLAWHYHWSESEILALTRRKRKRYLALLQEELDRFS